MNFTDSPPLPVIALRHVISADPLLPVFTLRGLNPVRRQAKRVCPVSCVQRREVVPCRRQVASGRPRLALFAT